MATTTKDALEEEFLAAPKRKNWLARSWEHFKYTACYQGVKEGFVGGITFGFVLGTLIFVASRKEQMRIGYKDPIVAGQKVKRPLLLQVRGHAGALSLIGLGFGVLFAFGGAIQGCSEAGISQSELVQRDLEKLESDIALMANKGTTPPKAPVRKAKVVEKFDPVLLEGLDPKVVALADIAKRQSDLRAQRIEQERLKVEALQRGERLKPAEPVAQSSGWWFWK